MMLRTSIKRLAVVVVGGGALMLFAPPMPSGLARPPLNTLTLAVGAPTHREIFQVGADGAGVVNLSRSPADDFCPKWTPLGDRLVFISNRSGFYELYVANETGTQAFPLTHDRAAASWPSVWSGSGAGPNVTFVSTKSGIEQIYQMNLDGTNRRPLTGGKGANYAPFWARDGKTILFVTTRDGNQEIYRMDGDGARQVNLSNNRAADTRPRPSPARHSSDGFRIAVPDGAHIVFVSDRDGNKDIFVMDEDGTNQRNVTRSPFDEDFPVWSPSGDRIAFVTNRFGRYQVAEMNPDGSGFAVLSPPDRDVFGYPVWLDQGEERLGYSVIENGRERFYLTGPAQPFATAVDAAVRDAEPSPPGGAVRPVSREQTQCDIPLS